MKKTFSNCSINLDKILKTDSVEFVKNLLPKRLFYRALLIVAIPIILIQLTITIVFFDSLWIKTNKGMTRALVGEIQTFIEVYSNDKYEKATSIYHLNFELLKDDESWMDNGS